MTYKITTVGTAGQFTADDIVEELGFGIVRNYSRWFDGENDLVFIHDLPDDLPEPQLELLDSIIAGNDYVLHFAEVGR